MTVPAGYALGRIQDFVEGGHTLEHIHSISGGHTLEKKVIIRLVPRVLTIQTV